MAGVVVARTDHARARGRARAQTDLPAGKDPICLSRLRRSTQVVTESTAVLFDTEPFVAVSAAKPLAMAPHMTDPGSVICG